MYGSFVDPSQAERAAAALVDLGGKSVDFTIWVGENWKPMIGRPEDPAAEEQAEKGITAATPGDVAIGAVQGTFLRFGLGTAAAIAALAVPGFGIVLGTGVLATAFAGALGAAAAGAAAGGIVGYLKDQGVGETYITKYSDAVQAGGSLLAVEVPTGTLDETAVEQIFAKYGATDVSSSKYLPTPDMA
jgi:hypothetical protein